MYRVLLTIFFLINSAFIISSVAQHGKKKKEYGFWLSEKRVYKPRSSDLPPVKPGTVVAYISDSNGNRHAEMVTEQVILENPSYVYIKTPPGGSITVHLPFGINVILNSNAYLYISTLFTKFRELEFGGEVYIIDTLSIIPLKVYANNRLFTMSGETNFDLYDDTLDIKIVKGEVNFNRLKGVDEYWTEKNVQRIYGIKSGRFCGWAYKDEDLKISWIKGFLSASTWPELLERIPAIYNTTVVANRVLPNAKFSGSIPIGTPIEKMVEIMSDDQVKCRYDKENNIIYVDGGGEKYQELLRIARSVDHKD